MTSKKPSVAKPPDGTVFFIDRSLGVEPIRGALKLVAGNMRGSEIADVFVLALRTICRILLTHQGPFIGRVGKRGQIKLDPQPPLDNANK